jgi:hypothetical protein
VVSAAAAVRGAAAAVRGATAAVISRQGMFIGARMGRLAYVALCIMRLVSLEVVEGPCPARGRRSMITVTRIVAVVDVAIEAVASVKPGASSNEQPANEPIRPIVAVGCAIIWGVVEVAVGAYRRHPDVEGNLGRRQGRRA